MTALQTPPVSHLRSGPQPSPGRASSTGPPAKPSILLVPNLGWWVIGAMAKEIAKTGSDQFNFYLLSESLLAKRPDLSRWLISHMDLVHALNETGVEPLLEVGPSELPALITWIHHVTRWSAAHQTAADHSQMLTVCTTEWAHRIRAFSPTAPPICVVPHGVDSAYFCRAPSQRWRYGIPDDTFAIGFVASKDSNKDDNRKGVDTLVSVLARLQPRIANLHIVLVGSGWEHEAGVLQSSGVSANAVDFLPRNLLPGFYSSIDAYLMTSRVEGGPCTVLEAMACGTPVVATRVGLVPAVIVDGVNGYSAGTEDISALAEALLRLSLSPALRGQIGAAGRNTVVDQSSWKLALQPLLDTYGTILAERTPPSHTDRVPAWFQHNLRFLRAALAADALLWLWRRLRLGHFGILAAVRRAPAMLEALSVIDIIRGVGMLTGVSFRTPDRGSSAGAQHD